jgi:glyoxylase-like metal-dependent hydrolase (beta-lactamase superfamily II)
MADRASVVTIDCEYVQPQFAASYLITSGRHAAFIDNNTAHSVPLLLDALSRTGFSPKEVQWIIITHVHLDHAGGTSRLAELCPNAKVLAHPKAARHVVDPERLVSSAKRVYGDDVFAQLYGEIKPVPAARVRPLGDGETVELGKRKLRFIHTRGHANHHFCVHDPDADAIFTGDAFGLRYPALQTQGLFVFPSTSPTDFDADEARRSVDKILDSGAGRAYPTHFGGFPELTEAAAQLKEHLDFSERLLDLARRRLRERGPEAAVGKRDALGAWCSSELQRHYENWLTRNDRLFGPDEWALLSLDLELNGDGIAHVAKKTGTPS